MIKKPKIGKIAIVVFLTVLIWVWADLAQDETLSLSELVTITVAQTNDPSLWITFKGSDGVLRRQVLLDSVELKGPASRVAKIEQMRNKGALDLDLFLIPDQIGLREDGSQVISVLNLLRENDQIKQLGLAVESCEPQTLTVQVRHLVKKPLQVQCVDENGLVLSGAEVDPTTVEAYAPSDEVRTARIRLSAAEQQQARESAIQKNPLVELAPGQNRDIPTRVTVRLPSAETALTRYLVRATLGFCFSRNLQGKYQVELQNADALESVFVNATAAAAAEFSNQPFHIVLYILDTDPQATDVLEREVVFNYPPQYGRNQITGEAPPKAQFRVVPIPSPLEEVTPP
jgi:hypothetical protein